MTLKTQVSSKVDLTRFGNELFNCVHYDVQEVEDLKREIDAELNHQLNSDFVICINDVKEAIANLKLSLMEKKVLFLIILLMVPCSFRY